MSFFSEKYKNLIIFFLLLFPTLAFAIPPLPPTNVQATDGTSTTTIGVTWVAPTSGEAVALYRVYRSTINNPCGAGTIVGEVASPGLAFNDSSSSLSSGQIYYYAVSSVNSSNEESISCSDSDPGRLQSAVAPLPPVNLTASQNFFDRIVLNWQAPTGSEVINSYEVYRSTDSTDLCAGAAVTTVASGISSFNDTSAAAGLSQFYSMKSVGPNGKSACTPNRAEGFRLLPPAPKPPANVRGSDGTFTNKILVEWNLPTDSTPITSYKLYRSTTPGIATACQSLLVDNISGSLLSLDDTNSIIPGRLYYYSMRSFGPNGTSTCSIIDPGHAKVSPPLNVQATDGTFTNKVDVTWAPPANSAEVTGYKLYRSLTPELCSTLIQTVNSGATLNFSDTNVIPGTIYHYSLKSISNVGDSDCSPIDPGHAKVSPPLNVQATDGTFTDRVNVTWNKPTVGNITGYKLYRSLTPLACSQLVQTFNSSDTLSYSDLNVTAPTLYYYSFKSTSAQGDSDCSLIDPGFAKLVTICSDGLDNDGDGLSDLQDPGCKGDPTRNTEKDPVGAICDNGIDDDKDGKIDFRVDGTGDPTCLSVTGNTEEAPDAALLSPSYIKFNTFLGQLNFAELINQGTKEKRVELNIYNLFGQKMIARSYNVPAKNQVDVDINALLRFACDVLNSNCSTFQDLSATQGANNGLGRPDGVVDTYGLVELKFDDSDPEQRLLGRMSFYRPNSDAKTYSFAFAREFRNSITGSSFATANTYDPQGLGNLVPNWAEVINHDVVTKSYQVNIYTQEGVLVKSESFTLGSLAEKDIQAGHEFLDSKGKVKESVYLVEVVPQDPLAPYSLSVSRYSSQSVGGGVFNPDSYNYAFSIDGKKGIASVSQYVLIAKSLDQVTGVDAKSTFDNWVEIVNTSNQSAFLDISFREGNGTVLSTFGYNLAPRAQYHFNASALLGTKLTGSVSINSTQPVIAQSLTYVHGSKNELQTGFVSPSVLPGRADQAGSINTFLQMQNVFAVAGTTNTAVNATFDITSFGGSVTSGVLSLSSSGTNTLQISNNSTLNFPKDAYGALLFKTPSANQAISEVRRVRVIDGVVDFVMPTAVK